MTIKGMEESQTVERLGGGRTAKGRERDELSSLILPCGCHSQDNKF